MAKPMRLPNGFGNINKLSGKRRNPYRARVLEGYSDDGKREYKTIGYFAKYKDALAALADYHNDPYSVGAEVTFAELYDKWSAVKFENVSASSVVSYKSCYSHCKVLHDLQVKDIKLSHMQAVIDNCHKGYQTLKKIKSFLSQLYDYAVIQDIIGKNHDKTEFINIGKKTESKKHYKFNNKEIEALWRWSEHNKYVQMILMMIYSGARPGEILSVKKKDVKLNERYFEIKDGKNEYARRRVPIHNKVVPFYENWLNGEGEYLFTGVNGQAFNFQKAHGQFLESYWTPVLKDIGILEYEDDNGELQEHLPHDTRHTFTSMWKEKKLDETFRRKIQGHSGQGIGEQVYTHIEMELLITEVDNL